jgi:hypothetical protein
MKRDNTFTQIKVQLRDLNGTINELKELAKGATTGQKQVIIDLIIQARQGQMTLVSIGQKQYPQIDWLNLAVGQLKSGKLNFGAINRDIVINKLLNV